MGIWYQNDVVSTSIRRNHVAPTLIRRHFYAMCPLGTAIVAAIITIILFIYFIVHSLLSKQAVSGGLYKFEVSDQIVIVHSVHLYVIVVSK